MRTLLIFCCTIAVGVAQENAKPPRPLTDAQARAARAAIQLHDQGKFREATVAYEEILRDNPDNPILLYEAAFSAFAQKELEPLRSSGATRPRIRLSAPYQPPHDPRQLPG